MSSLGVGDLGDSPHSGPEDHGHVRVRCHPGDGLDDSLQGVRGLPPIRRTVLVWYFRGTSMTFYPRQYTSPGVRDS